MSLSMSPRKEILSLIHIGLSLSLLHTVPLYWLEHILRLSINRSATLWQRLVERRVRLTFLFLVLQLSFTLLHSARFSGAVITVGGRHEVFP